MKKSLWISVLILSLILPVTSNASCNHQWSDWQTECEPGCYEDGVKSRECSVCYEYESAPIPSYGSHDWDEWETIIEPDCLNSGESMRSCSRCYAAESKAIPKDPSKHYFSGWFAIKKSKNRFCKFKRKNNR